MPAHKVKKESDLIKVAFLFLLRRLAEMVFKTNITSGDFGAVLFEIVASIYSKKAFEESCALCNFKFRSREEFQEGMSEWIAFGMFLVQKGILANAQGDARPRLASALFQQFAISIRSGGMNEQETAKVQSWMDESLAEYVHEDATKDVTELAIRKIFDRPIGSLDLKSPTAFELQVVLTQRFQPTLDSVERLFKQFRII